MKILHISEYANGGISTYINSVVAHQHPEHDVYVLISDYNSQKKYDIPDEKIFTYPYKRHPKHFLSAILHIFRKIKEIKPDVVHIHSTYAGLFTRLIYFLVKKDVKIIYCPHGWSFLMDVSEKKRKIYAWVERVLSRKTDVIINISQYEYNQSLEYKIPADKSVVVYNGVPGEAQIQELDAIPSKDKINMLFVGRFDKQKGLDILLDVFSRNTFPNIQLYIIGGGVLGDVNVKFPDNVVHLGWIDNKFLDSYYAKCDVLIMPSRWEGFGLVAVEAMKNKKAVIASNRGALPEIVLHGKTGYIFDISKPEQLIEILRTLDKSKLTEMGLNGYEAYKEKFSAERMNKELLECYV
ncbi:glycosyltransferase [Paenibacillus chartarius]|uniref:Glycosyltransferase n=1 Tax=Paenibacillus chartarius TaxID=747481 RepID=A0ABV6DLH9_9BACL